MGFFDSARQGNLDVRSAGGVSYLSEDDRVKFKASLGAESNSYVEFMAVRFLLQCAQEKNVKKIQAFGDSSLVIN